MYNGKPATKSVLAMPLLFLLTSCAAQLVPYFPVADSDLLGAAKLIEQVILEQPSQHRPSSVVVTRAYFEFGTGLTTDTKALTSYLGIGVTAGSSRSVTRVTATRIYFNSIGPVKLFKKRDWLIIDVVGNQGERLGRFYTRSENRARRFLDAIKSIQGSKPPERDIRKTQPV